MGNGAGQRFIVNLIIYFLGRSAQLPGPRYQSGSDGRRCQATGCFLVSDWMLKGGACLGLP